MQGKLASDDLNHIHNDKNIFFIFKRKLMVIFYISLEVIFFECTTHIPLDLLKLS